MSLSGFFLKENFIIEGLILGMLNLGIYNLENDFYLNIDIRL